MKERLLMWGGLVLLGIAAGCGSRSRTLGIYTWADYVKPELVAEFERIHGCRVVIDTFDSNEALYAKLKAGAAGYDLLFPSSYMAQLLYAEGMLREIDHGRLSNLAHIDPDCLQVAADPAMKYSVPYMITNTGIAYLRSRVSDFLPTWGIFERADLKGRMTMLNDMRETIGAALKYLGYSLNTRDLKELEAARDVVIGWKKNLAKFENEQYKTGLASGEFLLVHGYNGDILQVMEENEDIAFAVPTEGTSISCDDMVIPKTAREVELAYAFIDFVHDPARAAENTDYIGYLCPNRAAYSLMSGRIRNNPAIFLRHDIRARSEVIADVGEAQALYTRIWDEIKSAP
ncbi:MAG: spermidine/putrescine ABC transporter substrate-binding protein [Planctomycetota bacterium]